MWSFCPKKAEREKLVYPHKTDGRLPEDVVDDGEWSEEETQRTSEQMDEAPGRYSFGFDAKNGMLFLLS